jgi:cyanate permease
VPRSINSFVALGFGIIYTIVGLAGFFVSSGVPFVGREGEPLIVFDVNGAHNIVHLLIGVGLIVASRRTNTARSVNIGVGLVYLLLGVLGPFIDGTVLDLIGLNTADHYLHVVSGALLLGAGLFADAKARQKRGAARLRGVAARRTARGT